MEAINLNLSQILAVTWVWQCEITPKYLPLWQKYGIKAGCVRNPKLHLAAYNSLVDQLCSGVPAARLKYTKGAMSMFAANSTFLLASFSQAPAFKDGDRQQNDAVKMIRALAPGKVVAAEQISEPSEEDKSEARGIIRKILSVDKNGQTQYWTSGCITFTPGQLK